MRISGIFDEITFNFSISRINKKKKMEKRFKTSGSAYPVESYVEKTVMNIFSSRNEMKCV